MPTLAYPLVLLLALPLGWFLWRWRRRRFAALRFSGLALVRDLPAGRARGARRGPLLLWGLCLASLLLSLAGPRLPDPGSRVPTEGISIALVLDVSPSMKRLGFSAENTKQTRLEVAKDVVRRFLRGGGDPPMPGRPNDLIALVTFAQNPETDCPLTLDHEVLLGLLEEEQPRDGQGTNPTDALAWALHLLSKAPTQRKVLILLTDGEDTGAKMKETEKTQKPFTGPLQMARLAAHMNIPIYAIEIEPTADDIPMEDPAVVRDRMRKYAEITGGMSFQARDAAGLVKAYEAIDQMERDAIESFRYRRYIELDDWFAAAALGFVLLLCWLQATRWRTAP